MSSNQQQQQQLSKYDNSNKAAAASHGQNGSQEASTSSSNSDPHFAKLQSAAKVLSKRIQLDDTIEQATELSNVIQCEQLKSQWRLALTQTRRSSDFAIFRWCL